MSHLIYHARQKTRDLTHTQPNVLNQWRDKQINPFPSVKIPLRFRYTNYKSYTTKEKINSKMYTKYQHPRRMPITCHKNRTLTKPIKLLGQKTALQHRLQPFNASDLQNQAWKVTLTLYVNIRFRHVVPRNLADQFNIKSPQCTSSGVFQWRSAGTKFTNIITKNWNPGFVSNKGYSYNLCPHLVYTLECIKHLCQTRD